MFAIRNRDGLYLAVSHGDDNKFYYEIPNSIGGNVLIFKTRELAEQEALSGDIIVEFMVCE